MKVRRKKRYSHINIGLKILINEAWESIKGLDWHEDGFNFYINRNIDTDIVTFKKGVAHFSGTIIWKKVIRDDYVILEMILNRLLFESLEKIDSGSDTYKRIINLIRAERKCEEKKKLLIMLNDASIIDKALALADTQKTEKSLYRYGVTVVSEEWTKIVNYALETSSVVQALDNFGKELSRIADEIP
jgi:hypothetical protein